MRLKFLASLILVPVIGFIIGKSVRSAESASSNAYTIHLVSTAFDKEGVQVSREEKFVARRADGSRVDGFIVADIPGHETTITKTLLLTDRRVRVFVHGLSQSTSTTRLSDTAVQELKSLGSDDPMCTSSPQQVRPSDEIGKAVVLGFDVVKLRTTVQDGNTIEEWKAPQLNCEVLYRHVFLLDGRSEELKTINVQKDDPDSTLFSVPSNYRERSPSEIERLAIQMQGSAPPSKDVEKRLARLDERYNANRGTPIQGER